MNLSTQNAIKWKNNRTDQNIQQLCHNMQRPNLRITAQEENMEIQAKGIKNIFGEIVIENFSHFRTEINICIQ